MKIIEHSTPAGSHDLGDSQVTLLLTDEEYDAFMSVLGNAETPKPTLERIMEEKGPWDE